VILGLPVIPELRELQGIPAIRESRVRLDQQVTQALRVRLAQQGTPALREIPELRVILGLLDRAEQARQVKLDRLEILVLTAQLAQQVIPDPLETQAQREIPDQLETQARLVIPEM
jgi:hypothetical protein